jgi:two-component system, NarL family, sensor histidine kinase DesK
VALVSEPSLFLNSQAGRERRPGRWGWLVATVWLFYLGSPLQEMITNSHGPARVVGVAALVVFAVGYLAFFGWARRLRSMSRQEVTWQRVGYLAGMLALAALTLPAAGQTALTTLVYVVALAMLALPLRLGIGFTLLLLATAEVAMRVAPGWRHDGSYGFAIVLAAVAVFGIRRAMQRGVELAATRKDMAELAVQEERNRFARDLHDILGHSLTVITVKAELAGRLIAEYPDRAATEVADVEHLARAALADVRAAVAGYREISLAGELVSARAALLAADIKADLPTAVDEVPEQARELFAWAVREGVTNVVRHSGATHCTVRITAHQVEVVDDGKGLTAASGTSGHGLVGLRERASKAGARLQVGTTADGGFRLAVTVDR